MLSMRIPYFNLKNLYHSQQLCRMNLLNENSLVVHSAENVVLLRQFGEKIVFHCSEQEFFDIWYKFFSLDEAYNSQIRPIKKLDILKSTEFNYYSNIRPLLMPLELTLLHVCLLDDKFIGYNFQTRLWEFYKALGIKKEISIPNFGKVSHYELPPLKELHKIDLSEAYLSKSKENLLCSVSEACEDVEFNEIQKLTSQLALAYIKSHFSCLNDEQISHIMFSCFKDYSFCPEYYLGRSIHEMYNIETNSFKEWYNADLKTNIGLLGLMLTAKYNET